MKSARSLGLKLFPGLFLFTAAILNLSGATVQVSPGGDLQAALDAARSGDTVLLLRGTHPIPSGLAMRNGVGLLGDDRDGTILDGGLTIADAPRDNYLYFPAEIDDPRTRVSNLTVTGCHGVNGGISDEILFADAARFDFRIRKGSAAFGTGDPALAAEQGILHLGAEQEPVPETSEAARFRRGDANGDGAFDISDPISVLLGLFLDPARGSCEDAGDSDDDGSLSITDAIGQLYFLFLQGAPPAPPYPGCGLDATEDSLGCREYTGC